MAMTIGELKRKHPFVFWSLAVVAVVFGLAIAFTVYLAYILFDAFNALTL